MEVDSSIIRASRIQDGRQNEETKLKDIQDTKVEDADV